MCVRKVYRTLVSIAHVFMYVLAHCTVGSVGQSADKRNSKLGTFCSNAGEYIDTLTYAHT